jgi:exonuclease III
MKVTTWNVNASAPEPRPFSSGCAASSRTSCACRRSRLPRGGARARLRSPGYWCHWHGHKGYSGVGLHLRKETFPHRPLSSIPLRRGDPHRHRAIADWVIASVYVPTATGTIRRRCASSTLSTRSWPTRTPPAGSSSCAGTSTWPGAARRPSKLRKPTETGQTPEEQAMLARTLDRGLVDLLRRFDPTTTASSRGGRPGGRCARRTSGGASTTSWPARVCRDRSQHRGRGTFGTSDHAPVTAVFDVQVPAPLRANRASAPARKGQLTLFGGAAGL